MTNFSNIHVAGVSVEIWRAGRGRPMLFLHAGDGLESSIPFLELLAKDYDVIAPSHPGFGGSELPAQFDEVDDLAYFYLDLLRELGIKREVVLFGVSFGAWIAAELAVKEPHCIDVIILVGPIGAKFGGPLAREITDLFSLPLFEHPPLLYGHGQRIDYSDWPEEALRRLARNFTSFSLFGWSPTLHNRKLRQRLGRIAVPTLVIAGSLDRVVDNDYSRRFADELMNPTFTVIEGAGHYAHIDAASQVASMTHNFLMTEAVRSN